MGQKWPPDLSLGSGPEKHPKYLVLSGIWIEKMIFFKGISFPTFLQKKGVFTKIFAYLFLLRWLHLKFRDEKNDLLDVIFILFGTLCIYDSTLLCKINRVTLNNVSTFHACEIQQIGGY